MNTQTNRQLELMTPLGEDILRPQALHVQEAMSTLFQINLQLFSEERWIDPEKIVGQNVSIRLALDDGGERYFNGFVSRFSQGGSDTRFTYYAAEVVPWLWFLTLTTDCRIFQDLSVPEIL